MKEGIHQASYNSLCGHFPGMRKKDKKDLKEYRKQIKQENRLKEKKKIKSEFDEVKNHLRIKYILESTEQRIIIMEELNKIFSKNEALKEFKLGGVEYSEPVIEIYFKFKIDHFRKANLYRDIDVFIKKYFEENGCVYTTLVKSINFEMNDPWIGRCKGILPLLRY